MDKPQGLCQPARRSHRRRYADLCRAAKRRRLVQTGIVRARRNRPAHRRRRRAAGLFQRHRTALGKPPVPMGGARRRGLRMVGGAHAPQLRAARPGAGRPFPRLRRLLGNTGRRKHGDGRALDTRARRRTVRCRRCGAGQAGDHRRGSGRDHARCRRAAPTARLSGHAYPAVRLWRRRQQRLPAAQLRAQHRGLHRHP